MPTLTRIQGYIYNAVGEQIVTGKLHITAQQDFISIDGTKVVPFTTTVDLATATPVGLVDVSIYATVGASPSGLAYFVEFDPDPTDTSRPMASKNGYWSNYWAVPNTALIIPLGNFLQARRGEALANYMPVNGVVTTGTDDVYIGSTPPANTTKRIFANQDVINKPGIRYNPSTLKWEFTHDGTAWFTFAAEEAVSSDDDQLIIGQLANTTKSIIANQLATNKPEIRFNNVTGKWEFSNDGVNFYIVSGMLVIPTADLMQDWLYMVGGI